MLSSSRARAFLCVKNLVSQLKHQLSSYESNGNAVARMTSKIKELCHGLNMDYVNPSTVVQKVQRGLVPNMKASEVDRLTAEICATLTTLHPDYATLAGRIAVSTLHRETKESFSSVIEDLHGCVSETTGKPAPLISDFVYDVVMENAEKLNSAIVHERDYSYNYFGYMTLERSYLLKIDNKVAERPQHMLMRVSVGIHGDDIDRVIETYNLMSEKWFTHASPTLFNSGTPRPQLSSCFLLDMESDSIEGIFNTLKKCALISKYAGGIGLNVHKIRANGSYIGGTNGTASGLVPLLRVFNNTARYIGQGGNKRPAAFAVYLEPWHADVFEFLSLRRSVGKEEARARDLFYALWVPDLFMRRVEEDGAWSLMCPHRAPGLQDCWGEEFERLYCRYEREGRFRRRVRARALWYAIVESQIETGLPYVLYKDACNRKSNQRHLGTIRGSNLCTEVVQFSSPEEVGVCNLASISLPRCVSSDRTFDFEKLREVTRVVTRNLNRVIDVNYYPIPEAELSNKRHRPIGIGVQGLADAFILMRRPFDSAEARRLNADIFETLYFAALEASCQLAREEGPYDSYQGSPASQQILQYDMWNVTPSDRWNWKALKQSIARHGLRNSLLVAPMPTASTAQILGNNESIEPYTANIYARRVLSGEFQVVNHHLVNDLISLGLWNENMKNRIVANHGSIQAIGEIPEELRRLYRTVWEVPQRAVLEMAADRGAFVDQSQSLNVHMARPTYARMTSMHFHGWKLGLKTGMYYLRSKPAANAIQFTVDKKALKGDDSLEAACSLDGAACSGCSA